MHIRRIQLAHVRGITALDLDLTQGPLPGLCVIAGPNGSGKTTVLEAAAAAILGMLNASAMMEDTDRLIQEGHAAATAQVWLDGAEEDWREERDLKGPFRVKVVWDREKGPRDHPPEGNHAFVLSQLWGAAALGARRRGWCLAGYGVQRFAAAAPLSEALMTAAPRRAALVTLFRRDASLLGAWAWLQKLGSPQAIFFGSDLDRDLERGLKGFARSLLADLLYAAGVTAHVQGAAVDFGATGVVVATRSGGVPLTALGEFLADEVGEPCIHGTERTLITTGHREVELTQQRVGSSHVEAIVTVLAPVIAHRRNGHDGRRRHHDRGHHHGGPRRRRHGHGFMPAGIRESQRRETNSANEQVLQHGVPPVVQGVSSACEEMDWGHHRAFC